MLPVLIALVISSYMALSKPHKYASSMSVWFDTTTPNASSLTNTQMATTPAAQGAQTLTEFLSTRSFLVAVGRSGPVGKELAGTYSGSALDDQIAATLSGKFKVTDVGPQVVSISMTSTNPDIIPGTLNAVAKQYAAQITSTLQTRNRETLAFYQSQLTSDRSALTTANQAVASYLAAHPRASVATDVAYSQLTQAAFQAQENLTTAQSDLGQANLATENGTDPAAFHVVDSPGFAVKVSSKKHMIFTVVAGLIAGLVITLLALSALTKSDKTARRTEDIETALGLRVVGTIDQLPRQVRAAGEHR